VDEEVKRLLRQLPAVDQMLMIVEEHGFLAKYPRAEIAQAARRVLEGLREQILNQEVKEVSPETVLEQIKTSLEQKFSPKLRHVVNATGIVLHTNLGRAVLSREAQEAVSEVARGYSNLELNLTSGKRGSRYQNVVGLLRDLTGAEDALVVNNNAGAVLLALNTLARGREVVVSRGELVEIGGSFRIPEVMAQSGAVLVEVGSTNKTYPRDYAGAVGPSTALLLKAHTSNYRIFGFTAQVSTKELVDLGREYGVPVLEDLGSGSLVDFGPWGLDGEPTVQEVVAAGVDLVTFSGDKLLGGPQAGLMLGKKELIAALAVNPLTRALRVDKFTLAALEATLRAYYQDPFVSIPTLAMLTRTAEEIRRRAEEFAAQLESRFHERMLVSTGPGQSQAGGGSLPTENLPSWTVRIRPINVSAEKLAAQIRCGSPPVIGLIRDNELVIDFRTVLPGEEGEITVALERSLTKLGV